MKLQTNFSTFFAFNFGRERETAVVILPDIWYVSNRWFRTDFSRVFRTRQRKRAEPCGWMFLSKQRELSQGKVESIFQSAKFSVEARRIRLMWRCGPHLTLNRMFSGNLTDTRRNVLWILEKYRWKTIFLGKYLKSHFAYGTTGNLWKTTAALDYALRYRRRD